MRAGLMEMAAVGDRLSLNLSGEVLAPIVVAVTQHPVIERLLRWEQTMKNIIRRSSEPQERHSLRGHSWTRHLEGAWFCPAHPMGDHHGTRCNCRSSRAME